MTINSKSHQENIENEKQIGKKQLSRPILISIIIGLILLALVGAIGWKSYADKKEEQQYASDLNSIAEDMLSNGAIAEKMISVYKAVWIHTIDERFVAAHMAEILGITIEETLNYGDPLYTEGKFILYANKGDFDIALSMVNNYYTQTKQKSTLETSRNNIAIQIKNLNNPPEKYKDSYEVVLKLYLDFNQIVNFALEPSGSYKSYSDNTETLISNFVNKYNEFELRMPK